jgi:hypothetical protein
MSNVRQIVADESAGPRRESIVRVPEARDTPDLVEATAIVGS